MGGLGISLSLDENCRSRSTDDSNCNVHVSALEPELPSKQELQKRVVELKKKLTPRNVEKLSSKQESKAIRGCGILHASFV